MNISKEEKKSEREALKSERENKRIENYLAKQKEFFKTHKLVTGKRLFYSAVLCIFFGFLGVHSFYNRDHKKCFWQLIYAYLAVYIGYSLFSVSPVFIEDSSVSIKLRYFYLCVFLWAGYDLFKMCCRRYYVPTQNIEENNQEESKTSENIKLEIGSKSKDTYLLLTIIGAPLGLQYLYARYWRRMVFCLFNFIIFLLVVFYQTKRSRGIINWTPSRDWIFGTELILYLYVIISCLKEKFDSKGKLFSPAKYKFQVVLLISITVLII